MMRFLLLVPLLLASLRPLAQEGVGLLRTPAQVIPIVPGPTRIVVDGEGNILLLDRDNSRLYKYFAMTGYDSVLVIGGKANRIEGFLNPVEMVLRNRQNLFLLDDIERRIFLLNPNLRVSEAVDFADFRPGGRPWEGEEVYPVSFDVAPAGEFFVLNQLNNRILKINSFGEVESEFGGLDYGEGALYAPVSVAVDDQNYVYVADTTAQELTVFDLFGVYRYTRRPVAPFRWTRAVVAGPLLMCIAPEALYLEPLRGGTGHSWEAPPDQVLHDVASNRDFLFLLLENAVHLYPK